MFSGRDAYWNVYFLVVRTPPIDSSEHVVHSHCLVSMVSGKFIANFVPR